MAAETRPPRQYFRGPHLPSSRRPPNFSNCRRTARTIIHSAFLSVRQPVSQSVRLQSIRTDCLAVGEERGDREGERASEEYLSHGTKGRRMMTPSRLGSEQPTMRRAGQRGRERGGKGRRVGVGRGEAPHRAHLWLDPILRSCGGTQEARSSQTGRHRILGLCRSH